MQNRRTNTINWELQRMLEVILAVKHSRGETLDMADLVAECRQKKEKMSQSEGVVKFSYGRVGVGTIVTFLS